jgi:hypothetical protein
LRTPHASTGDRREAGRYEIRLTGHLDARWAARFDGLAILHEADGTTVLSGEVADQSALHGLLQRVRDLGIPLISVTPSESNESSSSASPPGDKPRRRSTR